MRDDVVKVAVRGEEQTWEIAEPYRRLRRRLQRAIAQDRLLEVIPLHKRHRVWLNPEAIVYLEGWD